MHQTIITLDHTPAGLDPDDVILYRSHNSIAAPPLFEPGPDHEPASPAWIACLVPCSTGGAVVMMPLWARVFRLTEAARDRRAAAADAACYEERERVETEKIARADAVLREFAHEANLWPADSDWPGLGELGTWALRALATAAGLPGRGNATKAWLVEHLTEWAFERGEGSDNG